MDALPENHPAMFFSVASQEWWDPCRPLKRSTSSPDRLQSLKDMVEAGIRWNTIETPFFPWDLWCHGWWFSSNGWDHFMEHHVFPSDVDFTTFLLSPNFFQRRPKSKKMGCDGVPLLIFFWKAIDGRRWLLFLQLHENKAPLSPDSSSSSTNEEPVQNLGGA